MGAHLTPDWDTAYQRRPCVRSSAPLEVHQGTEAALEKGEDARTRLVAPHLQRLGLDYACPRAILMAWDEGVDSMACGPFAVSGVKDV
jgi:hypothetical protein